MSLRRWVLERAHRLSEQERKCRVGREAGRMPFSITLSKGLSFIGAEGKVGIV